MQRVVIAPHLWRALEVMARDMAVEPGQLVNQAVFAWLRINGYAAAGTIAQLARGAGASASSPAPLPASPPPTAVAHSAATVTHKEPTPPPLRPTLTPVAGPPPLPQVKPGPPVDPGAEALQGVVARMAEIDADLALLAHPQAAWAHQPEDDDADADADADAEDAGRPDGHEAPEEPPEEGEAEVVSAEVVMPTEAMGSVEDRALLPPVDLEEAQSFLLENAEATSPPLPRFAAPAEEGTVLLRASPMAAYVQREGEERVRITGDRFIIGRGPQCDLIIDSPRVSREHVALVRSGLAFVVEDLGSSNGTFFNDERITRRELESGDVVRLGNELVSFYLFAEG
jgi:hypothetical protein